MTSHNYNDIIRQIVQYMPDYKLKFERQPNRCKITFIKGNIAHINIEPSTKFEDVKRTLDLLKNPEKPKECGLCTDDDIRYSIRSCSKCGFLYCFNCYINLIRTGGGLCKCPQCRHTSGRLFPDDDHLEYIINGIIEEESRRREERLNLYIDTHFNKIR